MPRKILIVEDHPEQAQLVMRIVRFKYNAEITIQRDGRDAVEWARKQRPDLVLLDLMLNDINGFDVCRLLREHKETLLTPIVILTALSDAQHRVHGFRVGANAYVCKPYSVDDLFEAIESALNWRARMEQEPREGEVTIQPDSEILILQGLNDLLVGLMCSTPYNAAQATALRQGVLEMAHLAYEWGLSENFVDPLRITYRIDRASFSMSLYGHPEGPDLAPMLQSELTETGEMNKAQGSIEQGADTRKTFGDIYRGLTERGLVDEVRYNEAEPIVELTKRFTSHPSQTLSA